ncbi:MAG TPA: phosphate signaling complex protein PhoU [Deltaproteobacteria bacterium]|nr:phosphate signaling complex protein PhoU [Deltaproteobacteria bacterium]
MRTLFLQMCTRSESMVRLSVRSVVERDASLGRSVVADDREIDRLEIEIDRLCLRYLATHKPAGAELRTITTTMKMVTDLERIGDLSVNLAERGLELSAGVGIEPGTDVSVMGELAAGMLRMAAAAFLDADPALARRLIRQDREVDRLNREAFQRWITAMAAHPDQVDRALALTSVSKYLERIADHACNLGEMVVFLVEGEDMRHGQR